MATAPAQRLPNIKRTTAYDCVGEPMGPCHVIADTPTGTLCGAVISEQRLRRTHKSVACPRNAGNPCVVCATCKGLLAGGMP